jgi:predicted MFS family arabinose efflux permease
MGAYVALTAVAVLGMVLMHFVKFPPVVEKVKGSAEGRPLSEIMKQPVFIVAAAAAALSYGVMNLLMAATPLAMQVCGYPFSDVALVLEWHVIGMFAPGFFTGHLIKKFGVLQVMSVGVLLNFVCIALALSGTELHQFVLALFVLGVGWNFVFTGSTTLAMTAWRPEEKDRGQAAINFCVFATMAVTSFASGALVTTQGWALLNYGSVVPVTLTALALMWLVWIRKNQTAT